MESWSPFPHRKGISLCSYRLKPLPLSFCCKLLWQGQCLWKHLKTAKNAVASFSQLPWWKCKDQTDGGWLSVCLEQYNNSWAGGGLLKTIRFSKEFEYSCVNKQKKNDELKEKKIAVFFGLHKSTKMNMKSKSLNIKAALLIATKGKASWIFLHIKFLIMWKAKNVTERFCWISYRQIHESPPYTPLSAPEGGVQSSTSCTHTSVTHSSIHKKILQFTAGKLKREP